MSAPKLLIMAGGTGGHVFPGIAVAQQMTAQGWKIEWLGTQQRMEAELVPRYGFPIHFIDIGGLRGKSIVTKLLMPWRIIRAFFQAVAVFKAIQPNVVLGMGGYASGPGGLAARFLGIPLVIHEQNAVFGMTNRYLSKIASKTLSGFDFSSTSLNTKRLPSRLQFVGNPIRDGFFNIQSRQRIQQEQKSKSVNILVVGGSLGALALNQQIPKVIGRLYEEVESVSISVVHQSGKSKANQVNEAYQDTTHVTVIEFIDDMVSTFEWADIIICRAGALTVAEVAGAGRAAIFVPLPIAVDDHQSANAKYLSEQGAAILIQQYDLENTLYDRLHDLITQDEYRNSIAQKARLLAVQHATQHVCDVICELDQQKGNASMQGGQL